MVVVSLCCERNGTNRRPEFKLEREIRKRGDNWSV